MYDFLSSGCITFVASLNSLQHSCPQIIYFKVIVAIISVWLWVEHRDSCERAIVENEEEDPNYKWLVTLAVDMSLSALANYFDKLPSRNNEFQTNNEYLNQKVAAVTSESLAKEVVVDHHAVSSWAWSHMIINHFSDLTVIHSFIFLRMLHFQYWMT